jgi:hypothetical protein
MAKKSYLEKQFEKQETKYVSKHGKIKWLVKTAAAPRQYCRTAIIYLALAVLWAITGTLNAVTKNWALACMSYGLVVLWCTSSVTMFCKLPFYTKKAEDSIAELSKLENLANNFIPEITPRMVYGDFSDH